jgi:hypothetical protein
VVQWGGCGSAGMGVVEGASVLRCGRIRFIGVVGMWLNGDECHQGGMDLSK